MAASSDWYNHGGWSGLPENLVAVNEGLRSVGFDDVGIVYNFHHAHDQLIENEFVQSLKLMKPYLLCINLNGMVDLHSYRDDVSRSSRKIPKPSVVARTEAAMIKAIIDAEYTGPIGVIGHDSTRDVREVLTENVEGLEYLLGLRAKPDWLATLQQKDYLAKWTPKARANSKFPYEVETDVDWVDDRPSKMDTGPGYCHSISSANSKASGKSRPFRRHAARRKAENVLQSHCRS